MKILNAEIAKIVAKKRKLNDKAAENFLSIMFDVIDEGLHADKQVKVKGLGTFKITAVKARESVNVNTGERVVIEGHSKVSFTPDTSMKELVNKPFSQFETVIVNDKVDVAKLEEVDESAIDDTIVDNADEAADEQVKVDTEEAEAVEEKNTVVKKVEKVIATAATALDTSAAQVEEKAEQAVEQKASVAKESVKQDDEAKTTHDEKVEVKTDQIAEPKVETVAEQKEETAIKSQKVKETPMAAFASVEESSEKQTSVKEKQVQEIESQAEKNKSTKQEVKAQAVQKEVTALSDTTSESAEEKKSGKPWLWIALVCVAALVVVFFLMKGNHTSESGNASNPPVVADSLAKDSLAKASQGPDLEKLNADPRLQYCAYDIVGIDTVVTLRKGQTMQSYCNATLGKQMIVYFQVLNDTTELGGGAELKVPKVKVRKR